MSDDRQIASAYDAAAPTYDAQLTGDAWMRHVLWDHYLSVFRPGQRVLDVSCGTGTDAVFLAHHGIHVVGIDLSPGMVARLREKVATAQVAHLVEARVGDLAELDDWPPAAFDGIYSSFAGLNGVDTLAPFARAANRLLPPHGHLIVHLLNRWSLWEWLGWMRRGELSRARALGTARERCFTVGGVEIRQYPLAPDETYRRFFAPGFRLDRAYGLGILRPPHTVGRLPSIVVATLEHLEARTRDVPWLRGRGRFFVLDLVRRPDGEAYRA